MASEMLLKARAFEEKYMPFVPKEERPLFHVTGGVGWINDPNGFSVYKGEYHLFYQYHPYSTQWGPMHWGHVKTKDFIKWERLPIALAPDTEPDKNGCFSGGAVEMTDGRQLLVYTGRKTIRSASGLMKEAQTQCIAIGDGIDYEKHPLNPVIGASLLPAGRSTEDFRDPKVWREGDTYYVVAGNRTPDGSGAILLYESKDAVNWSFVTTLDMSRNEFGRMWECPDFFSLDGQQVLLTSPQEMLPMGLEFHAGYGTVCMIGTYDPEKHRFDREGAQAIDYGLDFYAPQTLETPDGRRVMIAWMQNWSTTAAKKLDAHLYGEMTLPRELSIRNGRLYQNPVREIENYRGHRVVYRNVLIHKDTNLMGIEGRALDMTLHIRPASSTMFNYFYMHLAKDGRFVTTVRYKTANNTVRIDRSHCGFAHDIVNVREFLVAPSGGELKMRVILDKHSLELFINDGEQAATSLIYTHDGAQAISFEADGDVLLDVEKYSLIF